MDDSPDALLDDHRHTGMDDSPDALLDDLEAYMNGPAEEDEDEAWDSQLTEDEDPNYPAPPPKRQRCTSPPRHFTKSSEFWDSVEKEVRYYMDDEWFSIADKTIHDLSEDWERNVSTVERAVKSIALGSMEFKIGICRDPKWRWFVCDGGKYSKNFTKMTIVYAAKSSKPKHSESTGNMEIAQIAKFKDYDNCLNRAPGGEMPSDGSPHFCYVVSN
jgi:hypothetical protein